MLAAPTYRASRLSHPVARLCAFDSDPHPGDPPMKMLHLAVALLALSAFARANDFYVDAGATAPGDGTEASPFPTIQQAVDASVSGRGDRILINRGTYAQGAGIAKAGLSLIGVGTATIDGAATGLSISTGSSETLVENLTIEGCQTAVRFSGFVTTVSFVRCRIAGNLSGIVPDPVGYNILLRECDICCQNSVGVYAIGSNWNFERCTIEGNGVGVNVGATTVVMRDCIVAFNTNSGIARYGAGTPQPTLSWNDFFSNGSDGNQHYGAFTAGPNDVNVEPQFLNADARNFALLSTSPLINAGRDAEGLPVTIGAHEIGVLASAAAGADVPFSSWTDATGRAVTDPASSVVLQADGFLRLNGVATAAALSPVIDLGDASALTTNAVYRAIEDALQPSGAARVVDADNATLAREFRIRASDSLFAALDASPAWQATTCNAPLNLLGRYVQVEITLTTSGR